MRSVLYYCHIVLLLALPLGHGICPYLSIVLPSESEKPAGDLVPLHADIDTENGRRHVKVVPPPAFAAAFCLCTTTTPFFHRSAVVIIDNRELPSLTEGHGRGGDSSDAAVDVSDGGIAAAEMAETKKKLHLLTLQTLKYSTLWITLNVSTAATTACMFVLRTPQW